LRFLTDEFSMLRVIGLSDSLIETFDGSVVQFIALELTLRIGSDRLIGKLKTE
jgi:hypothetical protein